MSATDYLEKARALLRERLGEIAREMEVLIRERGEMRALLLAIRAEGPDPRHRGGVRRSPGTKKRARRASPLRNEDQKPRGLKRSGGGAVQPPLREGGPPAAPSEELEAIVNLARCYAGPLDTAFIARVLSERGDLRMSAAEIDVLLAEHGFEKGINGKWNLKQGVAG